MLKNAYLGAKIGFDTAANELSKVGCAASYQLYLYLLSGTQTPVGNRHSDLGDDVDVDHVNC